ncbi:MAG: hypothetical protein ACR2JK_11455 [Geodermatophilaceae bacterium]
MSQPDPERASWQLLVAWGLRKSPLIVACCAVGLGIALPLLVSSPARYQAEALVVAGKLEMTPSALPSYARAVFESDAMQRRVAADADLPGSADVGDRLDLVTSEEFLVLTVVAAADEPGAAADLADVAAEAYVIELNQGGSGVGSFALQSRAEVPTTRSTEGLPRWVTGLIGTAAGALLGLGLVVLIVAGRRPMLGAHDVTSAVRLGLIGVVVVPALRADQAPDPRQAPGLVPVARALLPHVDGSIVFASAERTAAARGRLLVLLATVLSTRLDVFLSGSSRVTSTVAPRLGSTDARRGGRPARPGLELVDGVPPADTLEVPQWPLPMVLVIRYGEPRAALRRLAADNFDEEILGVVMVDELRGLLSGRAD